MTQRDRTPIVLMLTATEARSIMPFQSVRPDAPLSIICGSCRARVSVGMLDDDISIICTRDRLAWDAGEVAAEMLATLGTMASIGGGAVQFGFFPLDTRRWLH